MRKKIPFLQLLTALLLISAKICVKSSWITASTTLLTVIISFSFILIISFSSSPKPPLYQISHNSLASELGFFDFKQPFNKFQSTPKGEKDICFEPKQDVSKSHPKEQTPQSHKVSEALSPALFFQTGVDFTTSGDFNGGSKDNGSHKGQDDPFGFATLKNMIQKQEYIEPYNEEPLNLIWSNEPLTKTPKTNPASSPTNRNKVKKEEFEGTSSKHFEGFDKFMGEHDEYFNFESMDQSRSEKDASRYFGNRRDDSEMFLTETIGFDRASNAKPGSEKLPPLMKKNTWEAPSRSNCFLFLFFWEFFLAEQMQ